ncbi:MAG: AAA family ATPase [Candidatus Manganitrophus sp. SA1]|nr:AAA family ATPase [Candidatus Manganitrophus morganii]
MYLPFFGFKEPPFKLSPDPRFFFSSKKHQEAFSHILYGLKERKGFIVVTGEVGTGKTTLCRLLLAKLDPTVRTALLFNPQLTTVELLQSINQDFGLKGDGQTKKALLDELNRFLLDLLAQGGNALLIIDEAQLLTIECLEEIRLLSNLETDQSKLIQILLIGQPELKEKLSQHALRQLRQRISIMYDIEPLDREEVTAYIESRIEVAGGKEKVAFAPKAIDRIYAFSNGFPRLINVVADQALLAAYVANTTFVSEALVQQAVEELKKADAAGPSRLPAKQSVSLGRYALPVAWGMALLVPIFLAGLLWKGGLFSREAVRVESVQAKPSSAVASSPPIEALTGTVDMQERSAGSPAPIAVQPGGTLPESSPSKPLFDPDGIYRVELLAETEKGAYLTLLNLLTPLPPEERWREKSMGEVLQWLRENNIETYPLPLTLKKVLAFNSPLLFSFSEEAGHRYQVLVKIEGEEALLYDPLDGRKRVPLRELTAAWKGSGILLWQEMEGLELPFRRVGPDPSVQKIQEVLTKEGLYVGPADGLWGPQTAKALRFFQQKEGLEEDGLFGTETHLLLSKRAGEGTPSLR